MPRGFGPTLPRDRTERASSPPCDHPMTPRHARAGIDHEPGDSQEGSRQSPGIAGSDTEPPNRGGGGEGHPSPPSHPEGGSTDRELPNQGEGGPIDRWPPNHNE